MFRRTADSRPWHVYIADTRWDLFTIELLTLFGASLAGWVGFRRLRTTSTPSGVAIASVLLRLLTGPGGVAEPTNWANTPAGTLRADAVPATHCTGIGSDWGLLQQIAAYEASRTGGDILSIYTTPSTRRKRKGNAVIKKTVLCAVVIGASAVLTSSAVAQANPATPIPVIESSAAQLCGAINGNPTEDGVIAGMNSLENRGLDEMDGALVLITAIHHVCPQHEALMMGIMGPIAAEEICSKPS